MLVHIINPTTVTILHCCSDVNLASLGSSLVPAPSSSLDLSLQNLKWPLLLAHPTLSIKIIQASSFSILSGVLLIIRLVVVVPASVVLRRNPTAIFVGYVVPI